MFFVVVQDRSPIYIHTTNSLMGLTTIRACKNQEILTNEFYVHCDYHTQAYFAFISLSRWFAIRLDLIAVLYSICIVFSSILLKGVVEFT